MCRLLHHGARRVAGRVRATLPSLGPREGAGVCAHPPALGVRVPLPLAAVAHLRHLLLRARLGGVQTQQRATVARAARAGHPEAGERRRVGRGSPGPADRAVCPTEMCGTGGERGCGRGGVEQV